MKDKATLLYEWRQLRLKLAEDFNEQNLQNINNWWMSLDYHANGFNFDDLSTWPDVWQLISDGYYTRSGNGLGCFYTVHHSNPKLDCQVWLIHDFLYSDIYLVAYADGYILNRKNGILERYEDIKSDISVIERHDKDRIIEAVKKSNQG